MTLCNNSSLFASHATIVLNSKHARRCSYVRRSTYTNDPSRQLNSDSDAGQGSRWALAAGVGLLLCLPHPWLQTGSGYHIYDNGLNPKHCVSGASVRRDLGFIGFDYDAMGPGKLVVRQQRAVAGVVWCGVVWCGVVWSGTRVGVWFVAM